MSEICLSKPKKCDLLLEEITGLFYPHEIKQDMEALTKFVGQYKVKDALGVLDNMMKKLQK